jgi:hypothetical protein
MTLEARLQSFDALGNSIRKLSGNTLNELCQAAKNENPWFAADQVKHALEGISQYLTYSALERWVSEYDFNQVRPQTIGLIMAGNIPLVGFHDLLSVLMSGHAASIKLSSKDSILMTWVIDKLIAINPEFGSSIQIQSGTLKNVDAIIATGSDNTSRHFEYYFRNYPHIIRHNRTSCSVLTGSESRDDLVLLGHDIFAYFGLGCRNVSKLFIPIGYAIEDLFPYWDAYSGVIDHHKYANNYDYQKAILLVNRVPFLDNGFVLLQENKKIASPVAVVYYEYYSDLNALQQRLSEDSAKLQCIVGTNVPSTVPFGKAQYPDLWDYADGLDTLKFLSNLC